MSDEQDLDYNGQMEEEDNRNDNMSEDFKKVEFVVPNSRNKLRACTHCRLIKSEQQWRQQKRCQNCGDFSTGLEGETTDKFQGVISIVSDAKSWVRRKKKLAKTKLVLGAYAVKLQI